MTADLERLMAWKLVPQEADGAMKMAGAAAPRSDATARATNTLERHLEITADIYRAMIAAAPDELPALLTELSALRESEARMREALGKVTDSANHFSAIVVARAALTPKGLQP